MDNQFVIGQATDPGIKRRSKPNQDSIGFVSSLEGGGKAPLLILADGMGGYNGGEIASSLAVNTIAGKYSSEKTDSIDYPALLRECIVQAHDAIRKRASENEQLASMGSTIVLAALEPNTLHIANVGDSRALLITSDQNVERISYDHSFVMDLVRSGGITEEEALHHPRRNVLTMSLNGKRDSIEPFVTDIPWKKGDTVLICSDGLWGCVTESQIANVVTSMNPQDACEKLINMANMNQGPDNISVLIARNGEESHKASDITSPASDSLPITGDSLPMIQLKVPESGSKKKLVAGLLILVALGFIITTFVVNRKQNNSIETPTNQITDTVEPTATMEVTDTVEPTVTMAATDTVEPTATMVATDTVEPTATMAATDTVEPTVTMAPTDTVKPTVTMAATETVKPTATMAPTDTVEPTVTMAATDTVEPTVTMAVTDTVVPTATIPPTDTPETTVTPVSNDTVVPTATIVLTKTSDSFGLSDTAKNNSTFINPTSVSTDVFYRRKPSLHIFRQHCGNEQMMY